MKTQISVRLSDDVIQAVNNAAKLEGRNRSQQIEWYLRRMVACDPPEESSATKDEGGIQSTHVAAEVSNPLVVDAPPVKRRLCKRHSALGMYEDECTGTSCRQERAEREARMA